LIVLGADTGQRPALTLGDELTLQQGDPVYAIGAPEGLELTLTNGIVSAFRNISDQFLIQSTAPIGHGSSGGPLFDRQGRVVGITSAMLSNTPGVYFSVGVGDLKRMLRSPQLLVLSFAEWAKQNAEQPEASSATDASTSENTDSQQIEKLIQNNKFDDARLALQSLAAKEPDSETVHRLKGELDEKTGDLAGAIEELDVSVGKDPSDAIGQFYYAIALFEARRFNDALTHEVKSNELAPTASDDALLSLLYYSVQNYQQAEARARKTIESDPNNETALSVLAGLAFHHQLTEQDGWSEYTQRLQHVDPDNFWVHVAQGYEALQDKQSDKTVAEFTAAEKGNFPDPIPYRVLASLYTQWSDFGPANDQIKAGLVSIPDDPQLLSLGMFVSLIERDNSEAERRFESLEASYPGTQDTLSAGCLYYYGIGQPTNAIPYCSRLVEQSPDNQIGHSDYGWVALDAGQFALAVQEFTEAYKIASPALDKMSDKQVIDLLWGFTIADYNDGNKKEAHKLFKIIQKGYPTATTVTGLQQLPLLWSATTMNRIEIILRDFSK
jgi:tetratricopeptide (TPR) repeat protein